MRIRHAILTFPLIGVLVAPIGRLPYAQSAEAAEPHVTQQAVQRVISFIGHETTPEMTRVILHADGPIDYRGGMLKGDQVILGLQQRSMVKDAVGGGAYAYFNHQAKFGVEQRFDSSQFSALGLFWDPSRQQINLEMTSKVLSLTRGQSAGYAYEVRYLKNAPELTK